MRSIFPAHFRPSSAELEQQWKCAIFAIDANVLLNLYRYSPATRKELEQALTGVRDQLFLPHQAAKEFLKNRLGVTASQAKEYTGVIGAIEDTRRKLSDKKRHPFISESTLSDLLRNLEQAISELTEKRETLLERLIADVRLEFIESTFEGKTGTAYSAEKMESLLQEGADRYKRKMPPGFKDDGKDSSEDPSRKYGDLILWKQIIDKAKESESPVIMITDDSKEDWWLRQSGRTVGPRFELREEFLAQTNVDFWMYSVEGFLEHSARARNSTVSQEVIEEVVEVETESRGRWEGRTTGEEGYKSITEDEMLRRLRNSERWAQEHEGFIGLISYVHRYLGTAGYNYGSCFQAIDSLVDKGLVEIYEHQGDGYDKPIRAVRVVKHDSIANKPFEGLDKLLSADAQ